MGQEHPNPYDDPARAEAYAGLGIQGTYYLAYRDLPDILATHVRGTTALDFGCGAGRSTRFLRDLGFSVTGIDISEPMVAEARVRDPGGTYQVVPPGDLSGLPAAGYDVVLAAFPFDNISSTALKITLFRALRSLLSTGGRIVNVSAASSVYLNEWLSFSSRDFPANRSAKDGDTVWAVMLDGPDRRPIADTLWTDDGHREVYRRAGLEWIATYRPLGATTEPFAWVSETTISPWLIEVLQ
jgi:SAM-dependent methyltransferase